MDSSQRFRPPFVWPNTLALQSEAVSLPPVPFDWLSPSISRVLGVVSGIDMDGVFLLTDLLSMHDHLTCALLVAVAPACPTDRMVLSALYELVLTWPDRVALKLCVVGTRDDTPSNILLFGDPEGGEYAVIEGPSPNFGLGPARFGQVNLVIRADSQLVTALTNWFDWQWANAYPLNEGTLGIPDLVPAKGDLKAAIIWAEYEELLRQSNQKDHVQESLAVEVEPSTGAVVVRTSSGEEVPTITDTLGLPRPDPVRNLITRLYSLGDLVSVDKLTRIPPLDCPIKSEWFGIDKNRKIGAVSRKVDYRISALEDSLLTRLEARRNGLSDLLSRLSFALSDGQRWIPHPAKKLLEQEITRTNKSAKDELKVLLNGTVGDFVRSQKDRIVADANRMYQELYPGRVLPEWVITEMLDAVAERLEKANSGRFVPQITYIQVSAPPLRISDLVSPWGQPLVLLNSIAQYPRKCLTDPFFFRDIEVTEDDLADAMDIVGDYIWGRRMERRVELLARQELAALRKVMESSADQRTKCQWILDIMSGCSDNVAEQLNAQVTEP